MNNDGSCLHGRLTKQDNAFSLFVPAHPNLKGVAPKTQILSWYFSDDSVSFVAVYGLGPSRNSSNIQL
jgi:hypothetical protein